MFAHCHGVFVSGGVFTPREIFVAPIEEYPTYVKGFTIKPQVELMTAKDWRTNIYARRHLHGMSIQPLPGDLDSKEVVRQLKAMTGDLPLFVKGPSQLSAFKKITSDNTIIIDIERDDETREPFENLRKETDLLRFDFDENHRSMIKCLVYAHHLA